MVRLLAAAEVALGTWVLAVGGPAGGAIVAGTYAAFIAFALFVSRRAERPVDCGCFGAANATSAMPHLIMNAAAVAAGMLAIGTAAAVYAAYLTVTVLPAAWAAFPRRAR